MSGVMKRTNTDDTCEDEFMDLDMAEKIVSAFEMELFKNCRTNYCITINEKDPLLAELKKKLEEDLKQFEKEFAEKSKKDKYYWGEFRDKERIRHISALIEYFENHLGKKEEPYEILVDHYKERNHEKAVEFATMAIRKCQKDQTPFFLFLLQDTV